MSLPAVWLLAANNLAGYVTLRERHLDHTAKITESELVPGLSRTWTQSVWVI
jgi:hypothetical protein